MKRGSNATHQNTKWRKEKVAEEAVVFEDYREIGMG